MFNQNLYFNFLSHIYKITVAYLLQLQDVLKFGIDKLLANQESSIENIDLEKVIGRSENGTWVVDDVKKSDVDTIF